MKNICAYTVFESKESDQIEYLLKFKLASVKRRIQYSGLTYAILRKIYNRGIEAWEHIRPKGYSRHQYAMVRVNSFINHGVSWKSVDKDLADKVRELSAKQRHDRYFKKYT